MTEDQKPSITMGDVNNNEGIVTVGQTGGNNTIINRARREPAGLYQNGDKIGRVQGPPKIDDAAGTIAFLVAEFDDHPDPTKPIEYQNFYLSINSYFPPNDGFFGKTYIQGLQCTILGRR